jgi:hypothetical protein
VRPGGDGDANSNRTRMSIAEECQSRRYLNRGGISIAEECRSTPIARGGRSTVIVEQCQFTANRGGMSIHHGPRRNVDLPRIAG